MRHIALAFLAVVSACAPAAPPPPHARPVTPPATVTPAITAAACTKFELPEPETRTSTAYAVETGNPADMCSVATDHIDAARKAALVAMTSPAARVAVPWDRATDPQRLDAVTRRLGLTKAELAALRERGFVVLEKQRYGTYTDALHEIFQSELPLWVSTDMILHAVYRSNDALIARVEAASLAPKLASSLERMHCALGAARYPAEIARDVDLYLTVARTLLAGSAVPSVLGVDDAAQKLVADAEAAQGLADVTIFGRPRVVDFSVYMPRGHYAAPKDGGTDLSHYFRAATWLSRLELNLVTYDCASSSKGDPAQTPREATVALALADLVTRAGATDDVAAMEKAWGLFAGKREDVSFAQVAALAAEAGIGALAPDSAGRLRAAIGRKFPRTARTHYTWQGCADLPAISTMLGARVVPDAQLTRPLVHSDVVDRQRLGIADVAYALGLDRAKGYLATDLATYPTLGAQLEKARAIGRAPLTGTDLYSAWLGAVRGIADRPEGSVPSFMRTAAYDDLRLGSMTAGFGQLRHNYVLFAAMTYGEAGCTIPDAFVEPAPTVYENLVEYAARGEAAMRVVATEEDAAYFARLRTSLELLRAIGQRELEGKPLPDEALRFLSMVVEVTYGTRTTGSSPTFTGWYFDMFRSRDEGLDGAAFLADYYTSTELNEAAYAGVRGVRLGVFVVDVGGAPRVVVGPVASAFEAHVPLPRLGDADVPKAPAVAPWEASYVVGGPPAPPLAWKGRVRIDGGRTDQVTVSAWSTRALGPVTIELLDHNRRPAATVTRNVSRGPVTFSFPSRAVPKDAATLPWSGLHVRVGEWDAWETGPIDANLGAAPAVMGEISGAYGGMKTPEVPPRERSTMQ